MRSRRSIELVENVLEIFRLLQAPFGHQFPGLLAQSAVRLLQIAAHLDERFFLAAKIHRERAAQFLVLLAELGLLGFERNVFRAEQFDMIFHVAVENEIFIFGGAGSASPVVLKFGARTTRPSDGYKFFQRELARLELRLDVFDKIQIRFFRGRVVRMAGHGDVTAGRFLVQRGVEFAPVEGQRRVRRRTGTARRAFPTGRTAARFVASRRGQWFAEQIFAACMRAIFQKATNSCAESSRVHKNFQKNQQPDQSKSTCCITAK